MLEPVNNQPSFRSVVRLHTLEPQPRVCSFSLFLEDSLSLPTVAAVLRAFPGHTPCHSVGLVLDMFHAENPMDLRNTCHVHGSAVSTEQGSVVFNMLVLVL